MGRFNELETFVRVVELGSFSAAAERLRLAKSVVSRRITELEERLGARLLNRTTRRLSLTDGGHRFYERAVRLLMELEEAEQALASGTAALRGRLRVAAPLSFGVRHLTPAVEAFLAANPEVELELDLNDRAVDLVDEGFDMALRIGALRDSTLVGRRVASIRLVTLASPDYLARQGRPRVPEDLARHQGLVYSHSPEAQTWRYADPAGGTRTVVVPARLRANNGDVLLQAAIRGLGVVVSPTFIAHEAIASGQLVPLLREFESPPTAAFALFPSHRHLPARVRAFIEVLAARFGDQPWWDECLKDPAP